MWSVNDINTIWENFDCALEKSYRWYTTITASLQVVSLRLVLPPISHNGYAASIVISSEMNCWAGRYCTDDDLKAWYARSAPGYSVFLNSGAVMGTLPALQTMLYNMTSSQHMYKVYYGDNFIFDDQYAMTVWAASRPDLAAIDHHQQLFGTYPLYAQGKSGFPFVCKSSDAKNGNFSRSCVDLSNVLFRKKAISVDEQSCMVLNHSSMRLYSSMKPKIIIFR